MEAKYYLLLRPRILWKVLQETLKYVRSPEDPHRRAPFQMSLLRLQDVLQSAIQPEEASLCTQMQRYVHFLPQLQSQIHKEVDSIALQSVPF
jgi:hypothetical protein